MRIRTAAVAAALAFVAAGCGNDKNCNEQTPPISGVPSCGAVANTPVTVPLHVCPRCDQGTPTCTVDMSQVASHAIELVPLSPVCDANSSCPIVDPSSCSFAPVNCTFTAPSTTGSYTLVVITPEGTQVPGKTLDVVASTPASCSGWTL